MDPILSLAITLHSNKGCYAVLLGSGVSRSAGIPTGWEVILDLSRRLAAMLHEDCEPDPAAWFTNKFGKAPDYADLLDALAKSPTERSQLLRPYFEPSPEERAEGKKLPTVAHRAIARLAQQGFIRVIVTTNFDKLMELALEEVGITPQVVASPDSAEGALPLAHSRCTVLKVHGDYLDSRIKNSPAELSEYHDNTNRLLDQIFDEYGLIACGWSAEWDVALLAAIERCKGRRFSSYWVARGEPTNKAKALIALRLATVIHAGGADEFFSELADKLISLDEISRPHPLSPAVAVATLKRYIASDESRIQLSDLVQNETERAYIRLCSPEFLAEKVSLDSTGFLSKLDVYNAHLAMPLGLMIHGCHWGRTQHLQLWMRMLERFAGIEGVLVPFIAAPDLRMYPATLLLYGGGLAAVIGRQFDTLAALLERTQARRLNDERLPAVIAVMESRTIFDVVRALPGMEKRYTPLSDYLHEQLRTPLRSLEPDDHAYDLAFDRFECMLAIVIGNMNAGPSSSQRNVTQARPTVQLSMPMPVGRFGWRRNRHLNALTLLKEELQAVSTDWPPLQAGMFNGDLQRVNALVGALEARLGELHWN